MTGAAFLAVTFLAGCCGKCNTPEKTSGAVPAGTLYAQPGAPPTSPIGVFDRTALLVAYYKSATHDDALAELRRERDAALADGDTARAAAIERRGELLQKTAHRQLEGNEPLTNIADALKDRLPHIAKEAGVTRIVERGTEPVGSRIVDITANLAAQFPSAR